MILFLLFLFILVFLFSFFNWRAEKRAKKQIKHERKLLKYSNPKAYNNMVADETSRVLYTLLGIAALIGLYIMTHH